MRRVESELDEELLARVDKLATASGRPRGDVIANALRRQLRPGNLRRILTSARPGPGLPEHKATVVAIAELDAYRFERDSA